MGKSIARRVTFNEGSSPLTFQDLVKMMNHFERSNAEASVIGETFYSDMEVVSEIRIRWPRGIIESTGTQKTGRIMANQIEPGDAVLYWGSYQRVTGISEPWMHPTDICRAPAGALQISCEKVFVI